MSNGEERDDFVISAYLWYNRYMKRNFPAFLAVFLLFPVVAAHGAGSYDGFAGAVAEFLKPDAWLNAFKKGVTIQIPAIGTTSLQEIELPTPEEALKQASPKLQEINIDVREEIGIDFAKFFGWLAKVFQTLASVFIGLLETVSESLKTKE